MILLRRELGDVLREHRQVQGRTLREVSARASVSLGYLSEVERGEKEASSELLAAICAALEVPLSEVLGLGVDQGRASPRRSPHRWSFRSRPRSPPATSPPLAAASTLPTALGLPSSVAASPPWQRGQENMARSRGGAPMRDTRTVAPHRRHGSPDRPCTSSSPARARSPVVVCTALRRLVSSSRCSRSATTARRPSGSSSRRRRPGVAPARGRATRRRTWCRCRRGASGRAAPRRSAVGLPAAGGAPRRRPSRGRAGRGRGDRRASCSAGGGDQLDDAEARPDRRPCCGGEDDPGSWSAQADARGAGPGRVDAATRPPSSGGCAG